MSREALQACELLFKKGADPARPDGFTRPLAKHVDEMLSTSTTSDMIRALFANPPERESRPADARQDETSGQESASVGVASQLAQLSKLREAGALTNEEYEAAKAKVLA